MAERTSEVGVSVWGLDNDWNQLHSDGRKDDPSRQVLEGSNDPVAYLVLHSKEAHEEHDPSWPET